LHSFPLFIEIAPPGANIQFDKDRALHRPVEGGQVTIDLTGSSEAVISVGQPLSTGTVQICGIRSCRK